MEKKIKKEKETERLKEELEQESSFRETKTGKFMTVLGVIGCILIVIQLILGGFEAFVNLKHLDYNKYRPLFVWGDCFGDSGLLLILGYFLIFWDFKSEQKRKGKKK